MLNLSRSDANKHCFNNSRFYFLILEGKRHAVKISEVHCIDPRYHVNATQRSKQIQSINQVKVRLNYLIEKAIYSNGGAAAHPQLSLHWEQNCTALQSGIQTVNTCAKCIFRLKRFFLIEKVWESVSLFLLHIRLICDGGGRQQKTLRSQFFRCILNRIIAR